VKLSTALLAASTVLLASCAQPPRADDTAATTAAVTAAVASPDRPAAETQRDNARKPADLMLFSGIKPGDRVVDLMPGGGYFTRIFSKTVGPSGHVYAFVPAEFLKIAPKSLAAAQGIPNDAYANVTVVSQPLADLSVGAPVDAVWTSDNYHDVYGFVGAAAAAQLDAAVYRALKPGGVFIVVDHVAIAGTSDTSAHTLHRIDPETVKQQVLAAGFKLEAESDVLRNPQDPHDAPVSGPAVRGPAGQFATMIRRTGGHTDQFVLKFRKPG